MINIAPLFYSNINGKKLTYLDYDRMGSLNFYNNNNDNNNNNNNIKWI